MIAASTAITLLRLTPDEAPKCVQDRLAPVVRTDDQLLDVIVLIRHLTDSVCWIMWEVPGEWLIDTNIQINNGWGRAVD